jgi:hypothetical protein
MNTRAQAAMKKVVTRGKQKCVAGKRASKGGDKRRKKKNITKGPTDPSRSRDLETSGNMDLPDTLNPDECEQLLSLETSGNTDLPNTLNPDDCEQLLSFFRMFGEVVVEKHDCIIMGEMAEKRPAKSLARLIAALVVHYS